MGMARHGVHRMRRVATGAVALAGGIAVGRSLAAKRQLIDQVAPELRSPLLYLPIDVPNAAALAVGRKVTVQATKVRPGVDRSDRAVPGLGGDPAVPVVLYQRPGREQPSGALVWIHGGGMIMGSPESAHDFCSRVAGELGVLVVSVDYRLAPEDPFPAGLHDCFAALTWVHENAGELGVDRTRIAVGGDSAGGGLAASLAQLAQDRDGPSVCFQLLVYPMLDDRTVVRAEADGTQGLIWTRASNRFGWTSYLGHEPTLADTADELPAAPARRADLAGLPPAWIGVGDIDLFLAEDVDYATRLEAAGVPCELVVEPGMFHGADAVLPKAPSMVAFRSRMVAALAAALE